MPQQETPYQHFARQLVDMWQQQLAKSLTDEKMMAQWVDFMAQVSGSGATAHGTKPANNSAGNTAHSPFSPELANAALVQLERRLAASEARIAELERELVTLRRGQRYTDNHKPAGRNAGTRGQSGTAAAQ